MMSKEKKNRIEAIIGIIIGVACLAIVIFLVVHYIQEADKAKGFIDNSADYLTCLLRTWNF